MDSIHDVRSKPPIVLGTRTFEPNDREGWTLYETETHYIDLMMMLFNFRVVMTPKSMPLGWDHGWCFEGRDPLPAIIAALAWKPDEEGEPPFYFKRACTCPRVLP